MQVFKFVAAGLILGSLVGCGGGGSGGSSGAVGFNSLVADMRDIVVDEGMDNAGNVTPLAAMPSGGQATYDGTVLYKFNGQLSDLQDMDNIDAAARLKMKADFASGDVTGNVSDFQSAPGRGPISGNVTMTGSVIENGYIATSSGTLVRSGVTQDLSGDAIGAFYGADADGVAGLEQGTLNGTVPYAAIHAAED